MLDCVGSIAATIHRAILARVVGENIEDSRDDPEQPLFSIQHASARVQAARKAADTAGIPFVLTARTDAYLLGVSDPFREAVSRGNAYRGASADCLFVPGAADPKTLAALVREIDGSRTVVMGLTGSVMSIAQLGALGVRRVAIGGSLARAAMGFIRRPT